MLYPCVVDSLIDNELRLFNKHIALLVCMWQFHTIGDTLKNSNMGKQPSNWARFVMTMACIAFAGLAYAQTPQTITGFAPVSPIIYSNGKTIALTAMGGGSGKPIVFTSATTSVCTVAGTTATVLTVDTCTLRANQAGNATFSAAPQFSRNVVVNKGSQTNTFATLSAKSFGVASFAVSATATSALAVAFTSTTTPICTVSGVNVTLVSIGTCTIAANQAGNTNFNAATRA